MSKQDIALRLKLARQAAHKTQKEVADALGMTYQAISNYERGKTKVESDILIKLSKIYGVSVPELLGESELPDSTPSLNLSDDEVRLISNYRSLSQRGRDLIQEQMNLVLMAYSNVVTLSGLEEQNTAAARSGDRVKVNHVSSEEEDAALPPDFNGGNI